MIPTTRRGGGIRGGRRRWIGARLSAAFALAALAAFAALPAPAALAAGDGTTNDWSRLGDGAIVLFRHATAPGGGDPPQFRLGDCASQRNLDENGRVQARRIGDAFRAKGIVVGAVWSSQWCRTQDTAELAFPGQRRDEPAFNSFFAGRGDEQRQTDNARALLSRWRGPGVLVVVTHQVNITALTGIYPASGEGTIVRAAADGLQVLGRLAP